MQWIDEEIEIDARAAAAICDGMRAVAVADGNFHDRELMLIESFAGEIPEDAFPSDPGAINTPELRTAFLRSLIMVALADGEISEVERDVINERASLVGIDATEVAVKIVDVKRYFIDFYARRPIFKQAVLEVARSMGLPADDIDHLEGSLGDEVTEEIPFIREE